MSGKGDNPRPCSVSQEVYAKNWNRVFGKKNKKPKIKRLPPGTY